jgi:hypothetical protein
MPTLLNSAEREALLKRLRALPPAATARWGRLTAPAMLCHLNDSLRIALGDVPCKPTHNLISRTLGKALVVNTDLKPPRGKIKTAPEMLASRPAAWDADLATCLQLVERVAAGKAGAVHPAFGPLTPEEWGRMSWKHMNHHLEQFGA